MTSLAESLEGNEVKGLKTGRTWKVLNKISSRPDRSNASFSVGYRVEAHDGRIAFMKATDLSLLTESGNLLDRIYAAMTSHKFERDVLDYCHGSNMDRIVLAIDYGDAMVEFDGAKDALFFLIFELADDDGRVRVDKTRKFTLAWCLNAMHEIAVGVQQLHGGNITHNDIKPANFLIFRENNQKLADLGCATATHITALHDDRHNAGDDKYAAPELLFALKAEEKVNLCLHEARKAADLYNLGSMLYFMVSGVMLTPQVVSRMAMEHRPLFHQGGWNGDFSGVEPYWREAFGRVLEELKLSLLEFIPENVAHIREEILTSIIQLCDPNPVKRGHPLNKIGSQSRYSVNRYVAAFDRMRKQAELKK